MKNKQQDLAISLPSAQEPDKAGPFHFDSVHLMDCVEAMRQLPANSVDLVIADPPYNASKGNVWKWDNSSKLPGLGGNWLKIMADWDAMSLLDYWTFTVSWLSEVKRVVRPTGSIWVHGTYHNIGIINFVMQLLDIEIVNEVVWYKRNSFPNLSGRRLTASHETILWAHTGAKDRQYYFDYEAAKSLNPPEDSLKKPGKQLRTVWDIPNNKQKHEFTFGKHPAQKPLRLLKRMLEISAKPGDLMLAPFSGSGTECVAAKATGVHYIGFETDPTFHRLSLDRIGATTAGFQLRLPSEQKPKTLNGEVKVFPNVRFTGSVPPLIKWTGE